ncbi:hypothetical protein [Paraburkholderia sp. DGU8]|jgi:signal transduction histidine kinase|uniref:hypothetical protein n=1 Tax=Paraburkholderia sp. DGU8 TaxID=3161997 RepID=UPI0034670E3A
MAPAHAQRASPPEPEGEAPPEPAADTWTAHPAHVNVDNLLVHCIQGAEAGVPEQAPVQLTESDASLLVQGDFGKLTQVFVNAMVNALKYPRKRMPSR